MIIANSKNRAGRSRLPDRIAVFSQPCRQFHFHLRRRVIGHRVVAGIKIGPQPQAELVRIAVGFIPAPVVFKPHLRRHPRAADIEAGLGRIMPRVRRPELPVFQNFRVQLDHINTMMPRRFLRMLLPMFCCEELAGGDDGSGSLQIYYI